MKITLAAIGFKTFDVQFNKNSILSSIKKYASTTDLILFGEAFLQGFNSLSWNFEIDRNIAITQSDEIIEEISKACYKYQIAVSFGYFELLNDKIYSSQITINKKGIIINNYRRVSIGWRVKETDFHYIEGNNLEAFDLNGHKMAIGLCGDLWYEENIKKIASLGMEIVLWPVYTDFNYNKWNNFEKYDYAIQAKLLNVPVVYVNSFCLDSDEENIAKGGSALFINGNIIEEIPSGKEGFLTIKL